MSNSYLYTGTDYVVYANLDLYLVVANYQLIYVTISRGVLDKRMPVVRGTSREHRTHNGRRRAFVAASSLCLWALCALFALKKLQLLRRKRERTIALHVTFGLSNRLRALSASARVSMASGIRLYLIWEPDEQLWASFDELYQRPSFIYDVFNSKAAAEHALGGFSAEFNLVDSHVHVSLAHSGVTYIFSHVAPHFKGVKQENIGEPLRLLEPVEDINLREERFIASNPDIYRMIGIHIRMRVNQTTDMPGIEKNIKLTQRMNSDKILQARRSCHYSHFLKYINHELRRKPSQRFFVAADSMVAIQALRSSFGNQNVVFLDVESTARCDATAQTRHLSCVEHAIIEQRLLSRTRFIYTSYYSSFSEISIRLSGLSKGEHASGCGTPVD